MAIDASIVFGLKQPQTSSPVNRMAQVLQIQGMQDQAATRRLAMERQNKLTSVLSGQYEKPEDREEALLRGGFVDQATALTKNRVDSAKVQADTEKNRIDAAHKRVDAWGSSMGYVRQNPTPENATAAVQHLVTMGIMPPEQAELAIASLRADPTPEGIMRFADMGFRAALSVKDQLPKLDVQNIGGQTITQSVDPVTSKPTITGAVQNTASPDAMLADQRGRATLQETIRHNSVVEQNQAATAAQGKIPPGYRQKADGTLEAIPGGPADIKAGEAGAKRERQQEAAVAQAERVISKVDEALDKVGWRTAGPASLLNKVPGSPARDLQATLDTIKANLGFAELQAMREASPTGGALGAIAVQELIALQSTVASLDQAQSPSELEKNLGQVKKHYESWRNAVRQANGGGGQPDGSKTMNMADVEATAKASGRSIEEVKKAAQAKGYTVR